MNVTEFSLDVGGGRSLDVARRRAGGRGRPGRAPRHPVARGDRSDRTWRRARERGLRLVTYTRPGYAGSTRRLGRSRRRLRRRHRGIADHLGVDRFYDHGTVGRWTARACVRGAAPGPSHLVRHHRGRRAIRRGRARLPGRHGAGEHRRVGRGRRKRGSIGGVPPDRCREAPERHGVGSVGGPRRPRVADVDIGGAHRGVRRARDRDVARVRSRPASGGGSTTTSRSCVPGGSTWRRSGCR